MVKRFPDSGVLKWRTPATQDPTKGTFVEGSEASIPVGCRLIPNGSGRFVPGSNEKVYQYKVSMDRLTETIPDNAIFEINGNTFDVLRHFTDQLRTQLWV